MPANVSIRPGVRVLSVLRHLNYKPWFALAEFVDNSLQSFLSHRDRLRAIDGKKTKCCVAIKIENDPSRITIRDNAAGIASTEYDRAFRPAEVPPDRSGLSEFGMGMKSASCWFAPEWHVRTSALGEATENTIRFDMARIIADSVEELDVEQCRAPKDTHFTEIVLTNLYKAPQGATIKKIKDHLASIYRFFLRDGELELRFNDELLAYSSPAVLVVPKFNDPSGKKLTWRKDIYFDFGLGLRARGFAALRSVGSTSEAGFALFRRRRLIEGSADEGYRPEKIFGRSNSYRYQRLFGELELEGFEISHTKDGFRWDENEQPFLDALKEELSSDKLPLLQQAEQYRSRVVREDSTVKAAAYSATERTAELIESDAPPVLKKLEEAGAASEPPATLKKALALTQRVIEADLGGQSWTIVLELTDDPAVGEWVEVSDDIASSGERKKSRTRQIGVRLSLAHPFTERFMGSDAAGIEALVRLAAAIGLADIAARSSGVRGAGTVRRNINELLRSALSKA
jgi:hypothetical protein